MTRARQDATGLRLRLHAVQQPAAAPIEYCAGATIEGLRECDRYVIEVLNVHGARLFVDDVEVPRDEQGRFAWTPAFYAGRVEIVVTMAPDTESRFYAYVGPASSKVTDEHFEWMVREIRDFRASLLLGTSSASMAFGDNPATSGLDDLFRLDRLRLHAPAFLQEVHAICRLPHRSLCQGDRLVSLSRAKRVHPRVLREPRIAAIVSGPMHDVAALDSLYVATSIPEQTFDTPSNRALKAMVTRVMAHATDLLVAVSLGRLGGDQQEQALRRPRRERFLRRLIDDAKALLKREPFRSVSRVETSAASLTQIAAQPAYGSAYRRGTRALHQGIGGPTEVDHLRVSPTWGVYETWCFVHLLSQLADRFGQRQWAVKRDGIVSAAESYGLKLADDFWIEAHFQANFPSGEPFSHRAGWSLSRFRIPDIVIAIRSATRRDFIVLDAKYRSKRENVLEAMESAHIYHDALRVNGQRPVFCALLLPAQPEVLSLDEDAFLHEHGVGTISRFTAAGDGVRRCVELIANWVQGATGEHEVTA